MVVRRTSHDLAALRSPMDVFAYRAMTVLPLMSVRKKSSGGVGTPTSSHDAPQVLYMLTGARLAALPSKALCKGETMREGVAY